MIYSYIFVIWHFFDIFKRCSQIHKRSKTEITFCNINSSYLSGEIINLIK